MHGTTVKEAVLRKGFSIDDTGLRLSIVSVSRVYPNFGPTQSTHLVGAAQRLRDATPPAAAARGSGRALRGRARGGDDRQAENTESGIPVAKKTAPTAAFGAVSEAQ